MAQVHGPLMTLRAGQKLIIVGSSDTVAAEILKTHDKALSSRDLSRLLVHDKEQAGHNKNLVFSSNCDMMIYGWRYIRNIYRSDLFSSKALEYRKTLRESKVTELMKYLSSKEGEEICINKVMFATAIDLLSNTIFSIDFVYFEGNVLRLQYMEDMIIIVSLVCCAIVYFLFSIVIKRSSTKINLPPLPPGPYSWPIIGNYFQIRKHDTHICLAEMAQVHGPLMSLRAGQKLIIVGSSATVASEILKTHDKALSARDLPQLVIQDKEQAAHNKALILTSNCDDGWRYLRSIYKSELFSSKALESRMELRESKIMEMVKYLSSKEGEEICINDVMFATAMIILSNTLLSMDLVDFEGNGIGSDLKNLIRRLTKLAELQWYRHEIFRSGDLHAWYKEVIHVLREHGDVWKDSLEKKRNGSSISSSLNDFGDTLIEKGFNDHQINVVIQELLSAGTESTSSVIEWYFVELLRNEEVMHKAVDEVMKQIEGNVVTESDLERLPYLEACFKETLRLHPPAPLLLPHKATQTCEVMGYTIPEDSRILVNIWAINRDPKIWDDPLCFKPERFIGSKLNYNGKDFEYIPFGSGRRMCPGQAMGSKTIPLIMASLIRNFDVSLPNHMNARDINMDETFNVVMRKKEPLHVIFKLRENSKN
uniref:probable (S)-N-methylcoclaurine 3'-hydroxylase isozyme 2 n=1 Tax=Erigeron canadensis TaxID=72917 RepID=UPI001CB94A5C|nr:probable (S)-N-methylcoclaurine 3'-hydroxylase isozyme 2 [Erigeron canadensis]